MFPTKVSLTSKLILAAILALSLPALADEVSPETTQVQTFSNYGLLGTWSPNCQSNPSVHNPRVIYRETNGKITHFVTFDGVTAAVVDEVGAANLINGDELMFTVLRSRMLFATVTVKLVEGRLHVIRSVGADGRVNVDQGINTSTRRPALIDERCAAAIS